MLEIEGESKQAERFGNDTIRVLYRIWPERSGAMHLFWNVRLQHGEQMNRNFRIKSFLSQNWGYVFTPKFGKNTETESFQDCVIKESIRCESVLADLDVMLESAILRMMSADDINGLYLTSARKMCRTLQIRKIGVQIIIKLGSFLLFKNCNESYLSRIHV